MNYEETVKDIEKTFSMLPGFFENRPRGCNTGHSSKRKLEKPEWQVLNRGGTARKMAIP
jgi:hypothetical protein